LKREIKNAIMYNDKPGVKPLSETSGKLSKPHLKNYEECSE
jgi:hypothetical protein